MKFPTQNGKQILHNAAIKMNNENDVYILHSMFSYKYSTYKIFMDTCNEKQYQNNISTYEKTRTMIQDYSSRKIHLSTFDYLIEYM